MEITVYLSYPATPKPHTAGNMVKCILPLITGGNINRLLRRYIYVYIYIYIYTHVYIRPYVLKIPGRTLYRVRMVLFIKLPSKNWLYHGMYLSVGA